MRLKEFEQEMIKTLSQKYFGKEAHIWLFGSRVDDTKRGGDIDLYVETPEQNTEKLVQAKNQFSLALQEKIGFQKIDIVLHRLNSGVKLPIYEVARQNGVMLI